MINIALAKGRLAEEGYELFKALGYSVPAMEKKSRKLIFESPEKGLRFILVKPADVPIYVEKGAADLGIVGKDTLLEKDRNLYELLDLGLGKCKFSVAGIKGEGDKFFPGPLRVATKYPKVAKNYFLQRGVAIDIIELQGSVELAPIIGLSDVIVDIVETGNTLVENGLEVFEDITSLSARLIANKVSFKTKNGVMQTLIEDIQKYLRKQDVAAENVVKEEKKNAVD